MKNFTAFIFNPNDIERLQRYLEDKNITENQYAFAFFGIFNGFASLSKDFSKAIVAHRDLQYQLDIYFNDIRINLNQVKDFSRVVGSSSVEISEGLSYEEIMASVNSKASTEQVIPDDFANQNTNTGFLQNIREEILLRAGSEKIISPKIQDEFSFKLENSLREIEQSVSELAPSERNLFINNKLLILFRTKYKIKGLGDKMLKKLFNQKLSK